MKTLLVQDGTEQTVVGQCLSKRAELTVCAGLEAAQEALASARFPLVVIDLEDFEETQRLCRWLREHPNPHGRFVLIVAPVDALPSALPLLETGADDLLVKPCLAEVVWARLTSVEHQIRRRAESERAIDTLNTRAQQQVAVAALGHCALSHDLGQLMESAGWSILYTLGVDLWCHLEVAENGHQLRLAAGFGWAEAALGKVLAAPADKSLTGRSLHGEDAVSENLSEGSDTPGAEFARQAGAMSGMSVAIKGQTNKTFGVLEAYSRERRAFVDDELRFLQGLANIIGATMEWKRHEAEIQRNQSQVQHLQRLESVGQLAAGLAHDYNNVLTIIHGHVTLALGDPKLPAKVATSMKVVLEAVERAANLTRQMLSFSRKQSLQRQPVDLNTAITGMARLLDRVLGRNVQLTVETCADKPRVHADPGMLDQVVMNLAVNARDAMPKGGSLRIGTALFEIDELQARRHPDARQGKFACLKVADTGSGMDEETLKRIFDPFFTTKEPGKGTGLGLSTVFGIVKQHEGWIEVESQPGHGTTFRVFLPSLAQPPPSTAAPGPAPALKTPGRTVLLVEDEPTLRQLARLLLEDLGHQVIDAGSGQQALEVWKEHHQHIDVLLTDLVLPDGVTGFELADRLQQEQANLKIIFTSGYSADEVKKNLPPDRGFQFVQKPYQAESLGRAIQACIEET
jgi:signal transduction histidine kinase/DNA-binding response OmpR family regulator